MSPSRKAVRLLNKEARFAKKKALSIGIFYSSLKIFTKYIYGFVIGKLPIFNLLT
jgi:hypothetical protein